LHSRILPGVSEIASFGGFQKQYQVTLNPNKLNLLWSVGTQEVIQAVRNPTTMKLGEENLK
jgi:Cu/Ag efflux pump CusA